MNIALAARLFALLLVAQQMTIAAAAASEVWDLGVHGTPSIGATGAIVYVDPTGVTYTNAVGAGIGPFRRVIGPGDSLPGAVGTLHAVFQSVLLPNASTVIQAGGGAPGFGTGLFSIAPSGSVQLLVDGLTLRPGTTDTFLNAGELTASFPFAAFCAQLVSSANPFLGSGIYTVDLRQTGDRPQVNEVVAMLSANEPQPFDPGCPGQLSINDAGTVVHMYHNQIDLIPLGGSPVRVVTGGAAGIGDPAPNGGTFGNVDFPSINSAGAVAFTAYVFGPNGYGVFMRDPAGNMVEVVGPQQEVPGHPGYKFQFQGFWPLHLLPDGTVIFTAQYDLEQFVDGVYRVRPPYTTIEVIFDAADPVLLNGQFASMFANPDNPSQPCTWAQSQANFLTCAYLGGASDHLGGVLYSGQFANDSGAVALSLDTPHLQVLGASAFASSVAVAATPTGGGVSVSSVVTLPDGTPSTTAQISFGSVQASGVTTVTAATAPSGGTTQPPTGFQFGTSPVYYNVSTTASFTGSVGLCFSWQEGQFSNESSVKLFHYENGNWQDVTTTLDTTANVVCGAVTSLSPFALVERSYTFTGFFQPVANPPILNITKAGSAIPVKFSLHGNQGLVIFYAGNPESQQIACNSKTPSDLITETATAGASSLSYDPSSDQYTYVWKTDKTWAQTCRRLLLKFNDRSQYTADFSFVK